GRFYRDQSIPNPARLAGSILFCALYATRLRCRSSTSTTRADYPLALSPRVGKPWCQEERGCPVFLYFQLMLTWKANMNIKAILLASAAATVAVSGAQAADAIVIAEPEPMEYVRICDAYGAGYFYTPGTETCLRVSGWVRYQIDGSPSVDGTIGVY